MSPTGSGDGTSTTDASDDPSTTDASNDASSTNPPNDASTTNSSTRLLAYAAALTVVVAVLGAYAVEFVLFTPLSLGHDRVSMADSGLATLLSMQVVRALFWAVVGLYLSVPVAVTTYLTDRGDRHWLYAVVWSAAAIVALPLLGAVANLLAPRPFQPVFALEVVAAIALPVAAGHLLAVRLAPDGAGTRPPAATFGGVAVAALFLVVSFQAPLLVPATLDAPRVDLPGSDGQVEQLGLGYPGGEFAFDYAPAGDGRGVLTITYRGGNELYGERLVVHGRGFADVPGVDQTGVGPWRGEQNATTGAVEAGDSMTVGVAADCRIEVRVGNHTLVDEYDCPGGDDARLGPRGGP